MNPLEQYVSIIHQRQLNPLPKDEYGEVHHIIPRSCGGCDKKWNKVKLTPEEHYLAHYWLTFIYATGEEHKAMVYAWNQVNGRIKGDFISAEEYGRLKRELSRLVSERMSGGSSWNKGIKGTGGGFKGHHHTDDAKSRISTAQKNKVVSESTRRKISEGNKGRPKSEEQKRKQSEAMKGHPAWNKNKKITEEARQHVIEAQRRRRERERKEKLAG